MKRVRKAYEEFVLGFVITYKRKRGYLCTSLTAYIRGSLYGMRLENVATIITQSTR